MPKTSKLDTQQRLIAAAAHVVHQQGFHRTTLADIAKAAKFPLGNLYYHFKTKEDLGEAILAGYLAALRQHFEAWAELPTPKKRVGAFIEMIAGNRELASKHGCPFGSLAVEVLKERASLAAAATLLFTEALEWLAAEFGAMGQGRASRALAAHVVTVWQGSLFLAQTFRDPSVVVEETRRLDAWLEAVSAKSRRREV